MKITYENEWERTAVHVDMEMPYEEDYQMRMLSHNNICSLLKVTGSGRDGQSRYTFYPGDAVSMEKRYSRQEMKKEDIERFTIQFMEMTDTVKNHLLDPDRILLMPELIFIKDRTYRFCYLPVRDQEKKKSLSASFHEMTEYFVKKLDYHDTEGILLVYRLHKETLKENYDLKKIMEGYRRDEYRKEECGREGHYKEGKAGSERYGGLPDSAVFCTDDEDRKNYEWTSHEKKSHEQKSYERKRPDSESVREDGTRCGPLRKAVRRIKNGRWGRWDDLITEIDGQEAEGHL